MITCILCLRLQLLHQVASLQPRVLVLKSFQATGVGNVHAAKLSLELVESRRRDAALAAHIRRLRPGFLLLQHPNDLFFREP